MYVVVVDVQSSLHDEARVVAWKARGEVAVFPRNSPVISTSKKARCAV